jgi:hypothetical protein
MAQALLIGEVHRLAVALALPRVLAEVELELPVLDLVVVGELHLGRERETFLGTETFERADVLVAQEGLGLGRLERWVMPWRAVA